MIKKITLGSILFLLIGCIGFFSSYADLFKALTSQDYAGLFDLREDQDTHQTWAKHQSGVEGLSRGLISYIDSSLSANTMPEVRLHEFIQEWHPLSNQASAYTLEVLAEVFQHMAHLIQEEGSANKNKKPQKTKKEVCKDAVGWLDRKSSVRVTGKPEIHRVLARANCLKALPLMRQFLELVVYCPWQWTMGFAPKPLRSR